MRVMLRQRGTTMIEMLIAATILALIIGAVYKATLSGQRSAIQVMQSHQVNEEIQNAIDHFSDDVREANVIADPASPKKPVPLLPLDPPTQPVDQALAAAIQTKTLATADFYANAVLRLIKSQAVPPNKVTGGTVAGMVKNSVVEYFFKDKGGAHVLFRKYMEIDENGRPIAPSVRIKPLIREIIPDKDYAVFFRIGGNQPTIGARNIFFATDIARKEKKPDGTVRQQETFHAAVLTSAHIRGSTPAKFPAVEEP